MARGTQLLQLVEDLREEVGRSSSVAVGNADLPGLKQKLRRTQALLYDDYDWPFLRQIFPAKTLQAGERYYDFPDGLNLERVEAVALWYNNLPVPITRGITPADYGIHNPEDDVRSEPALAWDVRWTGTKDQIEIWPLPATNAQYIQFTGIRALRPLIADSDVADLDDHLIVLFCAAEILARTDAKNAKTVMAAATKRLHTMRARVKGATPMRRMGQGTSDTDRRFPIVVTARAT